MVVWNIGVWYMNKFLFKLFGIGRSWRNFFIKISCLSLKGRLYLDGGVSY